MIAKQWVNTIILLLFLGAIFLDANVPLSHADMFFSTDIPITIGSDSFEERDVISHESSIFAPYLSGSSIGIPEGVNIDAFGFSGSNILFSVDIPTTLDGVAYTERDLIVYDGTDFSKLLDGLAIGIPHRACIDAATVLSDGSIVFSSDVPITLAGTSFKANDLIKYDGSSFDLYFSGSDNGIPWSANIDGVWVSGEGEILLSLDIPCSINGLDVKDKDIIRWSEGSLSLYFDGLSAGLPKGSDLNALSSGIEPCEGDFDHDCDVDGSDLAVFAADFGRTDCVNEPPCEGDFDGDGDVDGSDLAIFAADFGRTDCPGSLKIPYIKGYSNSGCLDMSYGAPEEYPGCGEDEVIARVEENSILVTHKNATYNCCPDDIEVTLSSQGKILTLYEKEILTTPCDCMCCYNIYTEIAGLTPGEYTIVVCWQDWETHGELCKTVKVIVP